MVNKIVPSKPFERKLKKFLKKFPSLGGEILELEKELLKKPKSGTHLGNDLYKIRLACKSKGGGKSGGFRVVTYLVEETDKGYEINLITIYDKGEDANVLKSHLIAIVKSIFG